MLDDEYLQYLPNNIPMPVNTVPGFLFPHLKG